MSDSRRQVHNPEPSLYFSPGLWGSLSQAGKAKTFSSSFSCSIHGTALAHGDWEKDAIIFHATKCQTCKMTYGLCSTQPDDPARRRRTGKEGTRLRCDWPQRRRDPFLAEASFARFRAELDEFAQCCQVTSRYLARVLLLPWHSTAHTAHSPQPLFSHQHARHATFPSSSSSLTWCRPFYQDF